MSNKNFYFVVATVLPLLVFLFVVDYLLTKCERCACVRSYCLHKNNLSVHYSHMENVLLHNAGTAYIHTRILQTSHGDSLDGKKISLGS